jgi:hypothetical protein
MRCAWETIPRKLLRTPWSYWARALSHHRLGEDANLFECPGERSVSVGRSGAPPDGVGGCDTVTE